MTGRVSTGAGPSDFHSNSAGLSAREQDVTSKATTEIISALTVSSISLFNFRVARRT